MALKDACEAAEKRVIRIGLTISAWARQVEYATLGENITVGWTPLEINSKTTEPSQYSHRTHPYLKAPQVDEAKPAARKTKPLMHHVETMSTFIQWQSWQMACHSGPLDRRGHASTPIPGSITHPGKECGYFTTLRLEATTQ